MKISNTNPNDFKKTELGLIPKDWDVVELGNILDEVDLRAEQISNYNDQTILSLTKNFGLISQKERFDHRVAIKDVRKYKVVKKNWIAYNPYVIWEGAIHSLKNIDVGLVSPVYVIWQCSSVDSLYLDFLLRTNMLIRQYEKYAAGAVNRRRSIKKNDFKKILIPFPPLPEQKKIAAVLRAVQEAKEKTEEVIKATKELKKSLMKHLFTYGPVPIEEAEKVKLKETEIGFFPKYWKLIKLTEQINKPQYGYTASGVQKEVGPKFLRITDIQNDKVYWNNVPFCECSKKDYEKYALKKGDILFARIGATTGKTYIVENDVKAVFASYLIRIKTKKELDSHFLFQFTKTRIYWNQIHSYKGGRLKQGINIPILNNILLSIPPLDIQQKICKMLTYINDKIEYEDRKKKALEELFKTLLNNLMTGKIRVNNLDIEV